MDLDKQDDSTDVKIEAAIFAEKLFTLNNQFKVLTLVCEKFGMT
jgi:hypothetical protein